ncbi:MAG: cytochrome C oxidase subunit IV family protein [Phycisphaerales bacterium]|nr:cytochrome C oxidase subunit IV family protein [Phycisphaerales bacterium]
MGKHEHGAVDHIVPLKVLIGTCAVLLFLTAVTVWVAELDFNILNIPTMNIGLALAVASLKVFIVTMIFMHLRWDRSFIGFIFVVSCLLVFLFIGFALMDTNQNEPDIIPGNSVPVQQQLDKLVTDSAPSAAPASKVDGDN